MQKYKQINHCYTHCTEESYKNTNKWKKPDGKVINIINIINKIFIINMIHLYKGQK